MTDIAAPATAPAAAPAKGISTATLAMAALALTVLLQVELVFGKSVNWDEYFHFSQIHQHLRGERVQWLQTPYIHLFGWVLSLPGSTVDHIQLIRLMLLPFELVTAAVIFDSTRRMAGKDVALVTTLADLTGGYIFLHGFALRADIIATGLFMGAFWFALWRPLNLGTAAAVLVLGALACIAKVKTLLLAPAFVGVLLMRRSEFPWLTNRLIAMIAGGGVAALALVAISGISPELTRILASSWDRMFTAGLFPQGACLFGLAVTCVTVFSAIYVAWNGRRAERDTGALPRPAR